MANSLTNFSKAFWSRAVQERLNKTLVALPLARFSFSEVTGGKRFHRPKASRLYSVSYTAGVELDTQDLTSADQYLDVDQTRAVHFFIDATEQLESAYNIYNTYVPEAAYALKNELDGKFFREVKNAFNTIGKLTIEWTGADTSGATLSTSNIIKALSFGKAKIVQNRVENTTAFYTVLEPTIASIWEQTIATTGSAWWDVALRNGYIQTLWALWLDLYVSNNLYHYVTATLGGNLSANDTVTISGVTFKLVASPAVAGDVDLWGTQADTVNNLVAAINKWAGAGTTYIELSQDDRAILSQNLVTASNVWDNLFIETAGFVTITEASSNITLWEYDCIFPIAKKWSTDLVIQKMVETRTQEWTSKWLIGDFIITWTKYWLKTFDDGKQSMLGVRVKMA